MALTKPNPENGRDRLRVLIADDVQETRRSARLMMTLLPNLEVVAVAQNGREAVQLARQHKPDIVLIDVNMPEMDGLTAVKAMLRDRPQTACLIMSAQKDSNTLQEAIAAGARGYLIKPFTTEELVDAMGRVGDVIESDQRDFGDVDRLRQQRDAYLKDLASEYIRSRRTDDKALGVFEKLAAGPQCEPQYLMALVMIYVSRRRWKDLKLIAERLEKLT